MPIRTDFLAALVAAFVLAVAPAIAVANPLCGNGIVDSNEECDGGPAGLHPDGDPDLGSCSTGSNCYFAFTCCKFNCQFVGTPGARCQDGNDCTGPDTCNQFGACLGGPNAANDTPCDDGLFCNGAESCQDGACLAGPEPCGEEACRTCNEEDDSCLAAVGVPCDVSETCLTGGICDGDGNCVGGEPNAEPCDDGLFCNGTDTCSGGTCSVHSGNPCTGPDGDGDCAESCDEESDTCSAPDPDGEACDDGQFCNGADACSGGLCADHTGDPCADPSGCNSTSCDEESGCSQTPLPDGTVCDDADLCTVEDTCTEGVCGGFPGLLEDLCPWALVVREHPNSDLLKTDLKTRVTGDICGGTVMIGNATTVDSDVVSARSEGSGVLRLKADAVVGGDIVSAGGGARGWPGSDNLPLLDPPATSLAPGSVTTKSDASGAWDLGGGHPLVGRCLAARNSYPPVIGAIEALGASMARSGIRLAPGETLVIEPQVPGALNVVDVDGALRLAKDATLELRGGGDERTTFVLRVDGKLKTTLRSRIALTDSLRPERVLVFVRKGLCFLGDEVTGGGTLLCSPGRIRVRRGVAWDGVLFGDGRMMKVGDFSTIRYAPFQAF